MSLGERDSRISPPSKRKSKPVREARSPVPGRELGSSKPNGEAANSEPVRAAQSVAPGGGVGKPKPSHEPGKPKLDSEKGGQAPDSGVGSSTPGNKAGNPKPVSEKGSPKPDSGAGRHKSNNEAGSEAPSPKPGSEAAGSTPDSQAGSLEPGNETGNPKPISQTGSVKPGSEAGSPKPGSEARRPKPDSEAGDSRSGNEVRNPKPVSETGSPRSGSEAGNDECSLKNPAEDAQFDDRYLPLRNLLHFLALEVDKLRDLFIINRLNTLLKRNISTPDRMLYGAILNDASPGRVLPTLRRKYTGFETFPWTDLLDSNIVKGVMGKPNERQAVIRDMVISVLRMSNPGVRIDFGAVEYS